MEAKEQAKRLIDKFKNEISYNGGFDDDYKKDAIECAIICVNELLINDCGNCRKSNQDYWEEVKQELEKLK